ncbi:MAG: hypothetical protein ACRC0G_09055 [Fusobacteriaceae bacterium]
MATIKNETNYIFSHLVLKNSFFNDKKAYFHILFKGEDEKAIKAIQSMWDYSYELANKENVEDSISKQEFHPNIKRGNLNDNVFYLALELPEPEYITDCKYVAIIYNQDTEEAKYFTFEKSYNFNYDCIFKTLINKFTGKIKVDIPSYILGGWESEKHLNFGEINDNGLEGFIDCFKSKI